MLHIKLNTDAHNFFLVGENRSPYFLLKANQETYITTDRCPHRGGPLHLGCWTGKSLKCPWHETIMSLNFLKKHALPFVRRKTVITAIMEDQPEDTKVELLKKRIKANE